MLDAVDLADLNNLKHVIGSDRRDLREPLPEVVAALPVQLKTMRDLGGVDDLRSPTIAAQGHRSRARDLGAGRPSQLCAALVADGAAGSAADLPALPGLSSSAVEAALARRAPLGGRA